MRCRVWCLLVLASCTEPIDSSVKLTKDRSQTWLCPGNYTVAVLSASECAVPSQFQMQCVNDHPSDHHVGCIVLGANLRTDFITDVECDREGCGYCTAKVYATNLDAKCAGVYAFYLVSED